LGAEVIKIKGRKIGKDQPVFIIGEIAQAHDGSLGTAHAYIDAIANIGADAVKFQTHIAEAESSSRDQWRVNFSYQDKTRFNYWKRMEFTGEQWKGLKKHAEEKGLIFLSSPFSSEAVELLERIGISAWKVASGEVNNKFLLDHIARTRLPVLLSSGMSDLKEIDNAVGILNKKKIDFAVLQCTSIYPCPPEKAGINLIPFFKERYGCPIGLSDHTGKIYSALAAVAVGASIIESHIVLSRECFGPDVSSSLTTAEFKDMVEGSAYIRKMFLSPVDKNLAYKDTLKVKKLFNKSIVYKKSLRKGEVLKESHLALVKPGTGITPDKIERFIGKMMVKDVSKGDLLKIEDLEDKY
jgi:N,N'-diacetyllegionaminate synthase